MAAISDHTLLRYCQTVYDKLVTEAKPVDDYDLLFEGKIMALFSTCGISNANYSRVMATLKEIGAIEQVRTGAKGVSTLIALYKRPEADDMERAQGASTDSPLTKPSPHDKLSQRVGAMERRLDGIDVAKTLAGLHNRLIKLESRKK